MEISSLIQKIDILTARKITLEQAKKYLIIPLYTKNNKIYVAKTSVSTEAEEIIRFIFNKQIIYLDLDKDKINYLIDVFLDYDYQEIENKIFDEAVFYNASDIHYEPCKENVNIRIRVNGELNLVRKLLFSEYKRIISRYKIKANMDITEKQKSQDGKAIISSGNLEYNCRLSTMPVLYGEKLVIRIIYKDKLCPDFKDLNLLKLQKQKLSKIITFKNGMVIIIGPTGSGKSTTLYTILNSIKTKKINITTLEDPVEAEIEGINQVNLNETSGMNFASGLKHILRQDPDTIMVGEIRDEETAKISVRAALTGHKVYTTLHTKSPREVFLRLQEMGVQEFLLRDALIGIVSQRLIKTLCSECRISDIKINIKNKFIQTYKSKGCRLCNWSGYKGRALVASVNYIDSNIKIKLKDINSYENILSNEEMLEVLNVLLEKGDISYDDYLEFIYGEELYETQ